MTKSHCFENKEWIFSGPKIEPKWKVVYKFNLGLIIFHRSYIEKLEKVPKAMNTDTVLVYRALGSAKVFQSTGT